LLEIPPLPVILYRLRSYNRTLFPTRVKQAAGVAGIGHDSTRVHSDRFLGDSTDAE
jgi:hypothetical protein